MMESGSMSQSACSFCGATDLRRSWTAREMYFGTAGVFDYAECAGCGSLNIVSVPADLAAHYASPGYGGHASRLTEHRATGLRRIVRNRLTDLALGRPRLLAKLANPWSQAMAQTPPLRWLRRVRADRHCRILDVGCGGGDLLRQLWSLGFDQLEGIDKFVPEGVRLPGLVINKGELDDVAGVFDLVMMHHSLEHMPNPGVTLAAAAKRLAPGGWLLVRVPLADSVAWRDYGVDWYQLDAPRHLHVPTVAGMRALAAAHGLQVVAVDHDATASQFVVSEGYRQGLSMVAQRQAGFTHVAAPALQQFEARTAQANADGEGDQAAFFLRRTNAA